MKRVKNLEELIGLARLKKSLMMSPYFSITPNKPIPAAFIINMQLIRVFYLLEEGMYIHEPKKKKSLKK